MTAHIDNRGGQHSFWQPEENGSVPPTYRSGSLDDIVTVTPAEQEDKSDKQDTEPSHGRLLPLGRFLAVYACLAFAVLLISLDQTIVACILPGISSKFGSKDAPWVGIAFLLTQTTCSPLYGRMSDVFGRKALFLIAHIIFFLGTVLCAAAPSIFLLILGRAIAGVGGAGLFSLVHICVSDIVTLRKRGTYHGILSIINGTGAALGPLIGGLFSEIGPQGWRYAFYFQLPIIGIAAVATTIFLPTIGHSDRRLLKEKLKTIDYIGSILFVGGSTVFLLGLLFIRPPQISIASAQVLACLIIGSLALVAFFVWEGKGARMPIVPLAIFKNVSVDLIFILNFTFGYIFYAALYYVPAFFTVASAQSPVQSSITIMPLVVCNIFFSWASGFVTSLTGRYKGSLVLGFVLIHLGTVLLYVYYKPGISQALAAGIMTILGIGFGCQLQNTLVACQSATRQRDMAMATSVRNFFRNIGGVFGIAISGVIVHITLPSKLNASLGAVISDEVLDRIEDDPLQIYQLPLELQQYIPFLVKAYSDCLQLVFLVFVPLAALSMLMVILLPEYSLDRSHDGEPVRREPYSRKVVSYLFGAPHLLVRQPSFRSGKEVPVATAP